MNRRLDVISAFVLALIVAALPQSALEQSEPDLSSTLSEEFDNSKTGPLAPPFRTISLSSKTAPVFSIALVSDGHVLTEASPRADDILYYATQEPMKSIQESYTFTYSGPSSVVEPFLFDAAGSQSDGIRGYVTNLSASAPQNNVAGDESFVYHDSTTGAKRVSIRGRLRTEPYFYRIGHHYRVDLIADPVSKVLATRVYDSALGPQTFDESVKGITASLHVYPGLINPGGGHIAIGDFSFGPAYLTPLRSHIARRAAEYMNYLGYNAAVDGEATSMLSLAFQKYFPPLLIKHVRIPVEGGKFAPSLNAVSSFGINADVLTSKVTTVDSLRRFITSLRRPPDSIELWNEPNNVYMGAYYDSNFLSDLPPFAKSVAAAFPSTRILGPSILPDSNGYPSIENKLADELAPYITNWNTHSYTRSYPENTGYGGFFSGACGPSHKEDCGWYGSPNWNDANSSSLAPSLSGISTEGAASYGTDTKRCRTGLVSLRAQQAYIQRGMLYNFKLGHERIYPYKFIDDRTCADGFGAYGLLTRFTNPDHSIRSITPKPAYTALVYLDHLLTDDGNSAMTFTPKPLAYCLDGAGADVEELLLAESDGSYRLILWSDKPLWNFDANGPNNGANLPLVADMVDVRLASESSFAVYAQTPMAGTWTTTDRKDAANNINVTVNQYPMIIKIGPAHADSRIHLPNDVATPGPPEIGEPR